MRSMARSAYSDRFIISQISNAALSAHLNLVEGHASIYPAEQLKFFSTARGSVAEALAGMAILEAEGRVPRSVADQLRAVQTGRRNANTRGGSGPMGDVPLQNVEIIKVVEIPAPAGK